MFEELGQFRLLVITRFDILKLCTSADHGKHIGLGHSRLHQAVVGIDTVVGYIIVGSDAAEVFRCEVSSLFVVNDHLRLVQVLSRGHNDISSLLSKQRILGRLRVVHSVDEGILTHAHIQIRVAEPGYCFINVSDGSQGQLGIQVIDHLFNESKSVTHQYDNVREQYTGNNIGH